MKNIQQLPVIIEKDEDGFYVVECPVFSGCYTQGKTLDEALKWIRGQTSKLQIGNQPYGTKFPQSQIPSYRFAPRAANYGGHIT